MIDELLDILKIAFLVLLYLFFLRVLWVVLTEVRDLALGRRWAGGLGAQATHLAEPIAAPHVPRAGVDPGLAGVAPSAARRAVSAVSKSSSRARARAVRTASQARSRSGRSPGCTVAMPDDAFISNLHARVYLANGDACSSKTSGPRTARTSTVERVQGTRPLRRGDRIQLGRTVLEAQ